MDTAAFSKIDKDIVSLLDRDVEYKELGYPVGHDPFTGLYFFKPTKKSENIRCYDSPTVAQAIIIHEMGLI